MTGECPLCQGRGVVLWEQPEGLFSQICSCRQAAGGHSRSLSSSGNPRRFGEMSLDNFEPHNPYQRAAWIGLREYVENFVAIRRQKFNSVLLIGDVGVGKTHLLAGAAQKLQALGHQVVFVNTVELIENLREAELNKLNPAFEGESLRSQITTLSTAEVVVFDDVGKEKITEWVQVQYYRLINYRYQAMLPTLFSSNLDIRELSEEIGSTVASRMVEMSVGRIYVIMGDNQRLELARNFASEQKKRGRR